MSIRSIALLISSLCVVSAAGALSGAIAGEAPSGTADAAAAAPEVVAVIAKPADIAGRWHSDYVSIRYARDDESCDDGSCGLTLDVVACGDTWCGIEVGKNDTCGATALKLDASKTRVTEDNSAVVLGGTLELARGTEPYVVEGYLQPAFGEEPAGLSITGDTGGEFRAFRRSFPFHAQLARAGEARCKLDKPIS